MKYSLIVPVLFLLFTSFAAAQTGDWKFSGQVQLRSELDGRDFSDKTHPLTFTSLRTRIGVEKSFENVSFFAQVQDSRVFGEEKSTMTNIKNLDLHQGYLMLNNLFDIPFSLQAGRFEVAYGTERFLGAVGWNYIGRAWDGARVKIKADFNLDLFALTQAENQGYIANPTAGTYTYPNAAVPSSSLYGFWSGFFFDALNEIDPFFYYDINRTKAGNNLALSRFTAGMDYFYKNPMLSVTFEGAFQFGKEAADKISAYLVSLQLMHSSSDWKAGIGADILSGNRPDDNTIRVFNVGYATNHKFYGYMDYFSNMASNTAGLGLQDFYLTAGLTPVDSKFTGSIWLHHFTSNQKLVNELTFGQEIDLTLVYNFVKGTALTWGGSIFLPGELMKTFFRTTAGDREDPSFWTYVMISAAL